MSGYSPANTSMINEISIMGLGLDESPSEVMLNDAVLPPDKWHWENMVVTIYMVIFEH